MFNFKQKNNNNASPKKSSLLFSLIFYLFKFFNFFYLFYSIRTFGCRWNSEIFSQILAYWICMKLILDPKLNHNFSFFSRVYCTRMEPLFPTNSTCLPLNYTHWVVSIFFHPAQLNNLKYRCLCPLNKCWHK